MYSLILLLAGVPLVDHHLHVFSPAASATLGQICAALGPKGCPPEVSHAPSTGAEVLHALDQAGIKQGVLLSGGYFFASPELKDPGPNMAQLTRAENNFIVEQARASCGRLIPFVSVNPLAVGAVDEVSYWGQHGGAVGLKLHAGSSALDFRNPEHVARMGAVFEAAGRGHLAIVFHMQSRSPSYGAEDVKIFLEQIYPRSGSVPVQIAHAAGGGGINPGELAALGEFAAAMKRDPEGTRRLYFDLAMVPDLFANAGKIPATHPDVVALEGLMHQIGLKHFVLGSDYTDGLNLQAYYANEKQSLGLNAAEWERLVTNVAPYVTRASGCDRN